MRKFFSSFVLLLILLFSGATAQMQKNSYVTANFTTGNKEFLLNGKPFVIRAAELHYARIPKEYWEHRIQLCKAMGMNTICIYLFWNLHEQKQDQFDFTGQHDVAAFVRLVQKNGMYCILRPGPYGWFALVVAEKKGPERSQSVR
jgi:beta-galactosidase